MYLDKNLSKEEYKKFWETNPNNHFMSSYEWGQICKRNRKQIPCYIGLKDDNNNILAACLLLKKKTPLKMCYFYAPRGFSMDYNNKELLKDFTNALKQYLKEENGIYLKVDPAIIYQEIDENAQKIENGKNNYDLFNYLISLGYHHLGFNKLYEHNQPRYTYRTHFKDYPTFDDYVKKISKTSYRQIKRSYNYNLEISLSDDIKTFYDLITIISNRNGFKKYTYNYYLDIYQTFKSENRAKNFTAKINIPEVINKLENELSKEKNIDRKNKLTKDIEFFKSKLPITEKVIASLICLYTNQGAWTMYIGNDDIAEYTGAVNRLYYEFYLDAYNNKYKFADLFGTVGDPKTTYKNLAGLNEYKRKLGGTYTEFIGEFDLINKPFWYKILPILLKLYRKIKK